MSEYFQCCKCKAMIKSLDIPCHNCGFLNVITRITTSSDTANEVAALREENDRLKSDKWELMELLNRVGDPKYLVTDLEIKAAVAKHREPL